MTGERASVRRIAGVVEKAHSGVFLLWGADPFLLRLAVHDILGDVKPVEMDAREWNGGETADLATPSLLGERRALVIDDCRHLPDQAKKEIAAYVEAPAPEAILILVADVSERSKLPANLSKLVQGKGTIREIALQRKDLSKWVQERARAKGITTRPDAASALIELLGTSPATLDSALDQLKDAFPDQRLTRELVVSQFRGLGEQHLWDLCDRAFGKDLAGATHSLASLLEAREDDPLMILGGIASRLRDLLRVKALPQGTSPAEAAQQAGLRFDWQGKRYLEQAKRFTMDELVRLHERVAEADRAMKSGASGDVVLPVVVAAVAEGAAEGR